MELLKVLLRLAGWSSRVQGNRYEGYVPLKSGRAIVCSQQPMPVSRFLPSVYCSNAASTKSCPAEARLHKGARCRLSALYRPDKQAEMNRL
jgi:hypothetical protein